MTQIGFVICGHGFVNNSVILYLGNSGRTRSNSGYSASDLLIFYLPYYISE